MKKLSFIALLLVAAFVNVEAQNEMQALRYSQYNPFGTARYAAQGGAISALGSDLSSVVTNPAGLGFYRSSEFSFSPSFYWVNTNSDFYGQNMSDSQTKFNLGSIGMVNAYTSNKNTGIVSAAFSVAYNTLVNFNNRTTIQGINENSSLLDDFTWHANANPNDLDPYYEDLAFKTNLMPYDSVAGEYWHDMQLDGYGQQLYRHSQQSGYIGEYSLAGALNVSNFLYLGATFGIHAVRFYEDIFHTETDHDNHVLDFDQFQFREFNSTRGWGYTFRFGMILRPLQMLRLGASFQLPTWYYLTDEKYTDMASKWDNSSGISDAVSSSPNGIYDYRLQTPFRANANASLILFQIATISAGYEFVDYSSARLDAYDYRFQEENDEISRGFQAAHNLKAGAEVRINSLYLRAGGQHLMSPFTDARNNAESWIYSGGLGFRTKKFYFDVSYSHSTRNDVIGMYSYEPGVNEVALNEVNGNNLMTTLGFKF
ncbi:MAG: hypothetical protein E4H10_02730 [Bacteroidia bacterium]|nr:MAG: hypothetical protein E4H10_02730 [Bacteroidia bacterium]